MAPTRASAQKKIVPLLALIAVELILYCTLGMASPSWQATQGALFAIFIYLPYAPILRGFIFHIIVTPWKRRSPAKLEAIAKWSLYLVPVVILVTLSLIHLSNVGRPDLASRVAWYLVCELTLGFLLMRINERWSGR